MVGRVATLNPAPGDGGRPESQAGRDPGQGELRQGARAEGLREHGGWNPPPLLGSARPRHCLLAITSPGVRAYGVQ